MSYVTYILKDDSELSEEEIKKLEKAASMRPVYDKDNPPLTDEQLNAFYKVHDNDPGFRKR